MIEIDMKLPSCCDECFAFDDYGCMISGESCGRSFKSFESRMPSCPLKDNEPRVLTLDEVVNSDAPVIVDSYDMPLYYASFKPKVSNKTWARFYTFGEEGFIKLLIGDYNKVNMWRCWSARPTEEQRKAVKWG